MKNSITDTKETKKALETWEKLARVFNDFSKHNARKIKGYGLTLPQFSILETLGNLGSMKIGELNNSMIYNGGNMTLVLDQLELMNYTRRTNSPTDRRAIIIELTDEGYKLFNEIYPKHAKNIKERFLKLNSSEQKNLSDLLAKLTG
jgi:MarR family 2-MHQ and catechol resistance regulon transcriptional repressor